MMNINYFTTPEALSSTIQDDPQIYEWFLNLILQQRFRNDFINNSDKKNQYQKFNSQRILNTAVIFLIFTALSIFFFLKYYWVLGIVVLFLIVQYAISQRLRRYVAEISLEKIKEDFSADKLSQTTLYQIGEFYCKKYSVFSIVDLLAISHEYLRTLLICIVLVFLIVYPFINILKVLLIITIVYFSFRILLNKSFIYKILRKK